MTRFWVRDSLHDHHHSVLAAMHIHLDHDNCLEMIAVRGGATQVLTAGTVLKEFAFIDHKLLTGRSGRARVGFLGRLEGSLQRL